MTENEAYAILHPDTASEKLAEIEYYAGFKGEKAVIKAIEDACIIACESMVELALYEEIGTVKECKEAVERMKPKKAIITGHNNAINTDIGNCPACDGRPLRACDNNYCPDCGQRLDWSK